MSAECQKIEVLRKRIQELEGLKPELPPMPPKGGGLPRYGLRWNGASQPLAVPMADGYWTPHHLAAMAGTQEVACAAMRYALERLSEVFAVFPAGGVVSDSVPRVRAALELIPGALGLDAGKAMLAAMEERGRLIDEYEEENSALRKQLAEQEALINALKGRKGELDAACVRADEAEFALKRAKEDNEALQRSSEVRVRDLQKQIGHWAKKLRESVAGVARSVVTSGMITRAERIAREMELVEKG